MTYRLSSHKKKSRSETEATKGPETVKPHYRLTGRLPPSPSPSSSSGKGGERRREGRKEEMTNWENYFAICGTCCVQVFEGGGKVAFSPARAVRLWALRSKLSPFWKVTALHDISTSLSTVLFTFLPWLGSNFTFDCRPANAILHLQPERPLLGLTKASHHLPLQSNGPTDLPDEPKHPFINCWFKLDVLTPLIMYNCV